MQSLDEYLLTDNLRNPAYVNPLYKAPAQQQQPQQVNYGYIPNATGLPMPTGQQPMMM